MWHVDSALVNVVERVCRRLQNWTGRTNVWLAFQLTYLSIILYFVWVVGVYMASGDVTLRLFVAVFCGGVFFVVTQTILKVPIETSEAHAYRRVAKGLRNPRRVRDAQLRIAFLTLAVMLAYPVWFAYVSLRVRFAVLMEMLIVLTAIVLYL